MGSPFVDRRWEALVTREWRCASCSLPHEGLFDLACHNPDQWLDDPTYSDNGAAARENHVLTEDFCILNGEHFFVRCVLELPLIGAPGERFGYGVWSSLSKANFDHYRATFDDNGQGRFGTWFGWLSNRLKGYPDTLNLKCDVQPQDGGQRPLIRIQDQEHPLAIEARDGVTFERLREIFALHGHAMLDVV